MNETNKAYQKRLKNGHFSKYLNGYGIDIGCGGDKLISPHPQTVIDGWDREQGDAQHMELVPDGQYDFVYSSHCLEHLDDVPTALKNWRRIIKPGGYLYVVVPDYLLFEKLCFPSRFNGDHKHTFSWDYPRDKIGRQNHWGLSDLRPYLGHITTIGVDDEEFDYSRGADEQTMHGALSQIYFVSRINHG